MRTIQSDNFIIDQYLMIICFTKAVTPSKDKVIGVYKTCLRQSCFGTLTLLRSTTEHILMFMRMFYFYQGTGSNYL